MVQLVNGAKKALFLFAQRSVDAGLAHPAELVNEINLADGRLETSAALFEDLVFSLDESAVEVIDAANNRPLTDYDVIYFRYWGDAQGPALAAARFCKLKGIPFIDSEVLRDGSFNKITQYMNLHEAEVPFPKTLIASSDRLQALYGGYGFTFPLVLKSAGGTRGQDNYVVNDEASLGEVLAQSPHLTFVLQEFLPNDGDLRIVVMGEKVVMAIKRVASGGSHLNNTSQGATAELLSVDDVPKEVQDLSVRAARFFGRQVAGVDMVQSKANGRWYCFEVNRSPQIERSSFASEKAQALNTYLRNLAK